MFCVIYYIKQKIYFLQGCGSLSRADRRFYRIQLYTHNSTRHKHGPNSTRPQLYTDHMALRLKLLSSERYEQSVNVITMRQKSRNTNVRTVRNSIVAPPYGLCRVVAV